MNTTEDTRPNDRNWTWQPSSDRGADRDCEAGLLYEPGNWGDILKGIWTLTVVQHLLKNASGSFKYLDPFAGAPDYPLTDAASQRFQSLPESCYTEFQLTFVANQKLGSTASLVGALCKNSGIPYELNVFDKDATRLSRWSGIGNAKVLEIESGEAALGLGVNDAQKKSLHLPNCLLVDPYDFFDHWGKFLGPMLIMARRSPTLVYLYNKSPRGEGYQDQYQRFRKKLKSGLTDKLVCYLGRIASDIKDPRANHEMLLIGSDSLVEELCISLEGQIQTLIQKKGLQGAFEVI